MPKKTTRIEYFTAGAFAVLCSTKANERRLRRLASAHARELGVLLMAIGDAADYALKHRLDCAAKTHRRSGAPDHSNEALVQLYEMSDALRCRFMSAIE